MNDNIREKARAAASKLTREQKAQLLAGDGYWHVFSDEKAGIPKIMVSDGPHGLRQCVDRNDPNSVEGTVPSTCFPSGGTTACSFDAELLRKVGKAIGEEARRQGVNVVLGPAVNHKRSPLCGRNFEYISEDPCLTGKLAAGIIDGIQSCGVGTSIKHFACNSQEKARFVNDSIVDERAMREIYLRGFEYAIRKSKPWTIMGAYNKVNGVHATESRKLMTDIARNDWGFEGLIMTDWGAIHDIPGSYEAGLDLEMPGTDCGSDKRILAALDNGTLSSEAFERAVQTVLELVFRAQEGLETEYTCDMDEHLDVARQAAEQSAVLLRNDGILPYTGGSVAVIGSMAKRPRYQGGGSSHIQPIALDNACEAFDKAGIKYDYADGYGDEELVPNKKRIKQAVKAAKGKDIVFIFAGLPASIESEGFDRDNIDMPQSHIKLIEAVAAVNPNVVVVLSCGSAIAMPWLDKVKGVLLMYLGGCQSGAAAVNLLTGKVNPSGKLAETFPLALEDTPCHGHFANDVYYTEYRESIFTGYRYYDTAEKPVLFPFGSGLSYTTFEYSAMTVSRGYVHEGESFRVSLNVTNTGSVAGKETVMLFASKPRSEFFRPKKELKDFAKVELQPGESRRVFFEITPEQLAIYNTETDSWYAEPGEYRFIAAPNAADERLCVSLELTTASQPAPQLNDSAACYYNVSSAPLRPTDSQFASLPGVQLPDRAAKCPVTTDSPMRELCRTAVGRIVLNAAKRKAVQSFDPGMDVEKMMNASLMDMPLRACTMSDMTREQADGLVLIAKGKPVKGLKKLAKGKK